jgi:hypothetical protein
MLGQAGSLLICTLLLGDGLCRFVFDTIDLWSPCHVSYLLVVLLGLVPWLLVVLKMFCNLSSGDWRPSCHIDMHSGCGKVHEGCPLLTGRNTLASVVCSCLFYGTPHSHGLLHLFSRILRRFGYAWHDCPCCEIGVFRCIACLVSRFRVNAPFCYDNHLLHLRICLLFPSILTPF